MRSRERRFLGSWFWVLPLAVSCLAGCEPTVPRQRPTAPAARVIPHELETHGHVRIDNYFWLRERENPEVVAYLEAENAYADAAMAHTIDLQETIFEEIKGRIRKDDSSVPHLYDGYLYYQRYEEEREYPIYCRKEGSLESAEEILLDVNALAETFGSQDGYFSVGGREISPNADLYAFGADTVGRRFYSIHVKDLRSGELLPDVLPDVTPQIAWANDNRTLFYLKQDPVTLRPHQVYRHVLGSDPSTDALVFEESDDTFWVSLFRSKSGRYIFIECEHTLMTEFLYLDAEDPLGKFTIIQPRERDLEYSVAHFGDHFYLRTNWEAKNFRLMKCPVAQTTKEHWSEVVPYNEAVFFQQFEIFSDHLVIRERREGLTHMRIIPWDGSPAHDLDFGEPTYAAHFDTNKEFDTPVLRYEYTSLVTPVSIYDYDMATREKVLRKQDEVLGGYDPAAYETRRLQAEARDGTMVPISIVYPAGLEMDGRAPLMLSGYGAYGFSSDPWFSEARLSLLERGFGYAIAHVRGGQELGRRWYEEGKLLNKKNTFTDFIDCAKFLCDEGYTSSERIFAYGNSAGGLLIGAVVNMAPEQFAGAIADVPWVDAVTTMLDASIPLTTSEYDEWGDPNRREYYDYMMSYSPYDNVEAKDYPALLVIAGYHDSQVQYWEPAKWVAKLRALKTDDHLLLLKTNMEAGHGGVSGRFRAYRETALVYAFMLETVANRR